MLRLSWAKSLDYFLTNNVRARQWPLTRRSQLAHARRFTNLQLGTLTSFDLLSDELNTTTRLGQPRSSSALGLMGLRPRRLYSAIDGFYVGAPALARFVNAAHANGRGVTLDVVYNHSLGSSTHEHRPRFFRLRVHRNLVFFPSFFLEA